jgi:hypothetical protein
MKPLRPPCFVLAALTLSLVLVAPAWGETVDIPIDAKGEGQITSQSPTETDTVSHIIGGGIIHGTTSARLFPTSFNPVTGIETFEGVLVLTTRHGTLTLAITNGVFDTLTGEFSNDSQVVSGTGRFDGAGGGLFFHGFVAADGSFTDDEISGVISVQVP